MGGGLPLYKGILFLEVLPSKFFGTEIVLNRLPDDKQKKNFNYKYVFLQRKWLKSQMRFTIFRTFEIQRIEKIQIEIFYVYFICHNDRTKL